MSDEPLDLTGIEARRLAALDADTWFTLDRGARFAITDALDDLEPLLDEVKRLRQLEALRRHRAIVEGFEYPTQPEETP